MFTKNFNIIKHINSLSEEFEKRNIDDIKVYRTLQEVPNTIFPEGYEIKYSQEENLEYEEEYENTFRKINFQPRDYQISIIDKAVEHFKNYDMGGLYLPPGYGKTFISTFIIKKLALSTGLVLTHRLSITREWIKCFNMAKFNYIIVNVVMQFV